MRNLEQIRRFARPACASALSAVSALALAFVLLLHARPNSQAQSSLRNAAPVQEGASQSPQSWDPGCEGRESIAGRFAIQARSQCFGPQQVVDQVAL